MNVTINLVSAPIGYRAACARWMGKVRSVQTGYRTPNAEAENARHTPLHRVGWPEDVADVIVYLASEQARCLTGQLLYVGGGSRMSQ